MVHFKGLTGRNDPKPSHIRYEVIPKVKSHKFYLDVYRLLQQFLAVNKLKEETQNLELRHRRDGTCAILITLTPEVSKFIIKCPGIERLREFRQYEQSDLLPGC